MAGCRVVLGLLLCFAEGFVPCSRSRLGATSYSLSHTDTQKAAGAGCCKARSLDSFDTSEEEDEDEAATASLSTASAERPCTRGLSGIFDFFGGLRSSKKDQLYKILKVQRRASKQEIKRSYFTLAKLYHPDVNPGDESAAEKFQLISEAYAILSDDAARFAYDCDDPDVEVQSLVGMLALKPATPDELAGMLLLDEPRSADELLDAMQESGNDMHTEEEDAGEGYEWVYAEEEEGEGAGEEGAARESRSTDELLDAMQESGALDPGARLLDRALLGEVDSHELVEVDEDGEPYEERFVFVDEQSCIGCYNCKNVAPETFFMEDEYGRARVFQQDATDKDVLQEALHTCPVDCIHYVEWDDLVRLEKERRGQVINFKSRLVGGNIGEYNAAYNNAGPDLPGNSALRCNNCPTNGCAKCPMYGVGADPSYHRKRVAKKRKREAKLKAEREQILKETGDSKRFEL